MRGIGRSLRYWLYNMEKTYAIMFLTVAAIMAFQVILNGPHTLYYMPRTYFPMIGSIFLIAMLMNGANSFIPQSLSSGGTRKEVFVGMEISAHLMIGQTLLLMAVCSGIASIGFLGGDFFAGSLLLYLVFAGVGNLLCACGLKFGTKAGMILYTGIVIVAAVAIGVLVSLDAENIFAVTEQKILYGILAAAAADLVAMGICYLAIRRYEVR